MENEAELLAAVPDPDISMAAELIAETPVVDPGAVVETNRNTAYRLPENPEDILA